jgi:hypothetical protein
MIFGCMATTACDLPVLLEAFNEPIVCFRVSFGIWASYL